MKRVLYTNLPVDIAATLSAPFFSIENFYDAIGAGIATVFTFGASLLSLRNTFAFLLLLAFAAAFVFGFWLYLDAIVVSFQYRSLSQAVMPFVPGIAMTNAVRDLMNYHLNSGMSKLFETLLITLALGAGTTVALVLMK